MLCAVHRLLTPVSLFFLIIAANNRTSRASSGLTDPCATWGTGFRVVGTLMMIDPEIAGAVPGLVIRRKTSREKNAPSTPMK